MVSGGVFLYSQVVLQISQPLIDVSMSVRFIQDRFS